MRRVSWFALVAVLAAILLPMTVSAAPKPQVYAGSVSDDGACGLTAVGTWPKGADVTNPLAAWYKDGTAFEHFVFSQDTDPTHANPGVIKKNTVTFKVGPLTPDTVSHDWIVRLDFYSSQGVLLNQTWTSPHAVNCTVGG